MTIPATSPSVHRTITARRRRYAARPSRSNHVRLAPVSFTAIPSFPSGFTCDGMVGHEALHVVSRGVGTVSTRGSRFGSGLSVAGSNHARLVGEDHRLGPVPAPELHEQV